MRGVKGLLLDPGLLLCCALATVVASHTPAVAAEVDDFMDMSLESLMQIEVTSVARKPQHLEDTTAAVYVLSHEDIRRSGVSSLPEALRLVPGMDVARINSNQWSIAIRGFNGFLSNKLLVLIDGRSVYTPIFSGVYWSQQDVMLADIDRIEVIRGPGGTLWGANAVNGVINIITRDARVTQGGLIQAGAGTIEEPAASVRYGGKWSEEAYYRVYARHTENDNFDFPDDSEFPDASRHTQIGGRVDWDLSARDTLRFQGDAYYGEHERLSSFTTLVRSGTDRVTQNGTNFLGEWTHTTVGGGTVEVQGYYDRVDINDELAVKLTETWDLELQHRFAWADHIDMLWGAGYRRVSYSASDRLPLVLDSDNLDLFSGFVQADVALSEKLRLTLGSKFEHNEFTGFEAQPNLRVLWQPHEDHSVWAAISRAVRTPSPAERESRVNISLFSGMPPILTGTIANPDLGSEELLAYELGLRSRFGSDISLDITAFYNDYDKLVGFSLLPAPIFETSPAPPHLFIASTWSNNMRGESYGVESIVRWRPGQNWRLEAAHALFRLALHSTDPLILDDGVLTGPSAAEVRSPQQQFQLRSYLELPKDLEFDAALFWKDRLSGLNIDDYLRADLHLGWRPVADLSLDLFLHNLLDSRHREGESELYVASEVPRSVFGRVSWRW